MIIYDTIFTAVLIVSAFLALHLEETINAVISFGVMLATLSAFYFNLGAPFAAVFQLAIAVGTIAVFFLAGEMLSPRRGTPQKRGGKILGIVAALVLSVPSIVLSIEAETSMKPNVPSFSFALWELRPLDILAQGVVILTLALGAVMVLKTTKEED